MAVPGSDLRDIRLVVDGLQFEALTAGPEDGEPVLLLHGFPQFADAWAEVMKPLAQAGFRVVAVNQRGYSPGARPQAVEAYGLPVLVADVIGFAHALGLERFHLAGHDWGGAVAWAFAAQHPDRLRSLTVLSTPHLDAFAAALSHSADQMLKSAYIALFRAPGHLAERTLLAFDARMLRAAYQGKVSGEQVQRNVDRLRADGTLTAALNWYRANSFEAGIGRTEVPTLYLWSDGDVALGEEAATGTEAFMDAPYRFVRLDGRSHWLLDEAPEQVSRLLLEHLRVHTA